MQRAYLRSDIKEVKEELSVSKYASLAQVIQWDLVARSREPTKQEDEG